MTPDATGFGDAGSEPQPTGPEPTRPVDADSSAHSGSHHTEAPALPSDIVLQAIGLVPTQELRSSLMRATSPELQPSRAVQHALRALHRHHDPVPFLSRSQYRLAVPYVVAALSEACLAHTIELLADSAEDPDRSQLEEALDQVRSTYPDTTIAVMLAGVATDDMPASSLCADLLATDQRYGLVTAVAASREAMGATGRPAD